MHWHASSLQSILERQKDPQMATARKLSDRNQTQWRRERRQRKRDLEQQLIEGAQLAEKRDTGKRKCDDMSAAEQHILEDFDTEKTSREYNKLCITKPSRVLGKLLVS